MVDLFRTKHWDLIKWRNIYFLISLLVIIPGLIAWGIQGFNLGIDFTGGGLITYTLAKPLTSGQAERAERLADLIQKESGIRARVQITGDVAHGNEQNQILVRTLIDPKKVKEAPEILKQQKETITALLRKEPDFQTGVTEGASEMVSPLVSKELIANAIKAVLFGCIFILGWIRIRYFDFKWAFSAVVALVHDVLVLLGVFAIFHEYEINMPFVAAALTVVGFSVHDTIIIFDRIRENLRLRKGNSFAETANISLLETLARSVNTVLTVVFVLLAVYIFGGSALRDFTFAMLVGVVSGAYSSIFNASQILVVLKQREERALAVRRAAQTSRRAAVKSRPTPTQSTPPQKPATPAAPKSPPAVSASSANGDTEAPEETVTEAKRDDEKARTRRKMKASGKRKRRF